MSFVARALARLHHEAGAQMVEYGFLLMGIALVVFIVAEVMGVSARNLLLLPMQWLR